jgi:hypothetical protein
MIAALRPRAPGGKCALAGECQRGAGRTAGCKRTDGPAAVWAAGALGLDRHVTLFPIAVCSI